MPKANHGQSMLSGLVDSDSDDQLVHPGTMPTPDSVAENKVPARRGRAKPKAAAPAKVTKTKAPARRASSRLDTRVKPAVTAPKGGRKALTDRTNQGGTDTEDIDDLDQNEDVEMEDAEDASVIAVKETKTKATRKAPAGRSKTTQETATNTSHGAEEGASNASALSVYAAKEKAASKRQAKSLPSPEKIIMETQLPVIDVDEEITQTSSRVALSAARRQSLSRVRQPSVQHRRAGSASDTERSDPTLRRKLGEITKKYENLNVKYQDLREIGLKEAERNFERLKKQTEEKSTASDKLIASLKAEIASQSSLAKESRGLKKKVESQLEEMGKLKAQVEQLKASLDEAQTQNKTLSTKLSANRGTAVSGDSTSSKPQGSNIGVNGGQAAQLKEDLYSDLTGLIVRGVKREAEDDTFDCIQTGRNGTLHFKLTAVNEKASESYEEAHCQYIPQLDPSRDKALMEILPDYLVDEISFPRPQAAKFYARVVKALTEKLE